MTKKLISLAVIAAGVLAANSKEIPEGKSFKASDEVADKLLADGLAKLDEASTQDEPEVELVEARVLADCAYGKWGEVIKIDPEVAKTCHALDTHPSAVAYAKKELKARADAQAAKE